MSDSVYNVIRHISSGSLLIPLAVGFTCFKAFNSALKALFIYLAVSLFFEVIGYFSSQVGRNYYVMYCYTVVESSFMAYFYFKIFRNENIGKIIKLVYGLYLGLAIFMLFFDWLNRPDFVINTLEAGCMIAMTSGYWFFLMLHREISREKNSHIIKINLGFQIYFGAALSLFLFNNYLGTCPKETFNFLWSLYLIAHIMRNLFITNALYKFKKQWQSSFSS